MKMSRKLIAIVLVMLVIPVWVKCAVFRVPADFAAIQPAIDAALDGDTVLIADGTYIGTENKNLHWNSNEKHLTVMSENGAETCVIDCEDDGSGFLLIDGCQDNTDVIQGLTVQNGSYLHGAGMYCAHSSPLIRNCNFFLNGTDNQVAGFGGAIYFSNSSAILQDCTFRDNSSLGNGGAIYCYESPLLIEGCIFDGNTAETTGGGIACNKSDAVIRDCEFLGNDSEGGGGISVTYASPIIESCIFQANRALYGGAIQCRTGGQPTIGGAANAGNQFLNNLGLAGSELVCSGEDNEVIMAGFNHFSGCSSSDYYVSPVEMFNLDGCVSDLTLIQQDIYVSEDGDNTADGLSWDTAFKTLEHALSMIGATPANPLSVHVAAGTYSPSVTGEVFPLPMVSHVSITGADAGTTIWDAEETGSHLFFAFDNGITISNLTLIGGLGDRGGAVYGRQSSPAFTDCEFRGNTAIMGGGVYFTNSSRPAFTRCSVIQNSAANGGGIIFYQSSPVLNDTLISNNISPNGGGFSEVYCDSRYTGCTISNNEGGGGATLAGYSQFDRCLFSGNRTEGTGGALTLWMFSPIVTNCIFTGNQSDLQGGGIYCIDGTYPEITNCTFTNNQSQAGSGIYCLDTNLTITNTIIWNNLPDSLAVENSRVTVTHSNIDGGFEGAGNINADPRFTASDNYHILADSPCIDTGTVQKAPDHDFDDSARPAGGAYDMGAYEFDGFPEFSQLYIQMPSHEFSEGDPFYCDVILWNADTHAYQGYPVFVLLNISNLFFFLPGFNDFDYYTRDIPQGSTTVNALPEFFWPANAGYGAGTWYAAVTDPGITTIMWNLAEWKFEWSE